MTVMNGRMNGKKTYPKPEEVIVNDLIKALENGVNPWRKEWSCKGGFKNLLTGKIAILQVVVILVLEH